MIANAATMATISSQLATGVRQPLARSLMTLSEMGRVPPEPRIQMTSPLQASSPARVTTNEGSRSRATRVPCSAPIAVVTSRAVMTAAHHGQSRDPMSSSAVITPPITETKPIDRSMSPSSSANTSLIPSSMKTAPWISRSVRFTGDRKCAFSDWKITPITIRPVITEMAPLSPGASQAAARRGTVMSARAIAVSSRSRPGGRRPAASLRRAGRRPRTGP